jgi:hypothetical protein
MFSNIRHDAIQPEEICLLQRVFDHLCSDANLATDSHQAELLGASIIEMFQSGTRDEAALLDRARVRHSDILQRMA